MFLVNLDPLAYGMAGLALMLALISLLIVVYYVRKLATAAAKMAESFRLVLEAHGYFDEYELVLEADEDEDDGDSRDSDDSDSPDGDDGPTAPIGSATVPLPIPEHDLTVKEDEEEAMLYVILHRADRDFNSFAL